MLDKLTLVAAVLIGLLVSMVSLTVMVVTTGIIAFVVCTVFNCWG